MKQEKLSNSNVHIEGTIEMLILLLANAHALATF